MPIKDSTNNPTTSTSITNTSNKTPLVFSAADFQRWNRTTSVVYLPAKLVGQDKIPKVRGELVEAIGVKKVAAVQALSPTKYRVEFRSSSYRHAADINGLTFRGLTITPYPAYEEVKSVFVDRAPLQLPDNYLSDILAPFGRVVSVEHLKVKGFPTVRSGTRRVSMIVHKAIPAVMNIGGFSIAFRYRGQPPTCYACQEVGHAVRDCPKSRKAKVKAAESTDHSNVVDLRNKIVGKPPSSTPPSKEGAPVPNSPALSLPADDLRHKLSKSSGTSVAPAEGQSQPRDAGSTASALDASIAILREVFSVPADKPSSLPVATAPPGSVAANVPAEDTQSRRAGFANAELQHTIAALRETFSVPADTTPVSPANSEPSESVDLQTLTVMAESLAAQSVADSRVPRVAPGTFSCNAPVQRTVPAVKSFSFSMTVDRTVGKARRDPESGSDDDDVPLGVRHLRKRRRLLLSVTAASAPVEESADECLTGRSVVDPIAPELPPLPASPVLSANIAADSVSVPVISNNTASTALPAPPPSTIPLGPETQSVSASPTTNDTSPGEVAHLSSENEAPDSPLGNETPSGSFPSTSQLPSPEISSQDHLFSVLVADATVRSGSSDPDTVSPAVDTRSALLADPRCLELMLRELPLYDLHSDVESDINEH